MNRLLMVVLAAAGVFLAAKRCAPSRAQQAPFEGKWTLETKSEINDSSVRKDVSVRTDGNRFRIEGRVREEVSGQAPFEYDVVTVFDGESLHEKTVYAASPGAAAYGSAGPSVSSRKPEKSELVNLRFWSRSFPGQAGAGGRVAGRETVLYQARVNRPDAEETVQAWVDAEKGVVLRSNVSLFSRQVESVVSKTTEECREVRFGPVDDGAFAKP
jgi:hypothetical protein